MLLYLTDRLLQSLIVLLVMSLLVFTAVFAIGNPVEILVSPDADQIEIAAATARLGLDRSLPEQYFTFLAAFFSGDLGRSFVHGEPALRLIIERFPATLELALSAMALAVGLGIPLGLWAGLRPKSLDGRFILGLSTIGFSLPTFWVALLLIMVFAVGLGWLPASGRAPTPELFSVFSEAGIRHIILPAATLACFKLSLVIRLVYSGTRENLGMDYVKFARAKGMPPSRIIGVHVLRNIMIPVVTVIGLEFGSVLAFAVVTESIFAWPGVGRFLLESIWRLDRPVVVAYLMLTVVLFVAINLAVDLIYAALDPRVRLRGTA